MIALAPANSLQAGFLENFTNQVIWQQGNDTQRLCCWLRFHPLHQDKTNAKVAEEMNEQLNDTFPSTNMPGTLKEVVKKIQERFGDTMQADGMPIDLLTRTRGRQRQHPDAKSPWQIIYHWLWEIEFPRQGWKLAEEIATYAMEELQMVELKNADRDLVFNVAKNPATIRKGEEYALRVTFRQQGHLLLINQGMSGKRYCLCPSRAFSWETQVMPDKKLHLPGINALANSLKYDTTGNEYFLAILTENPVKLSWANLDSDPKDILVTDERLREIFQEVGRQWNAQVFFKKFEVVE